MKHKNNINQQIYSEQIAAKKIYIALINTVNKDKEFLQDQQVKIKAIDMDITKELSVIETIESFLLEYNEQEIENTVEFTGSTVEQLNQLNDYINSINTDI